MTSDTSSPDPRRLGLRIGLVPAAVAAVAVVAFLGACGASGTEKASPTTAAKTTTTVSTTTSATAASTTTTSGDAVRADSELDAQKYRGSNGTRVTFDCPANTKASTIWGVETYTDDSSICTAAAHVGLLDLETGGPVTIEIAPGEDRYQSGTAHGISSVAYGSWAGSYTFPDAPPGSGTFEPTPQSWSTSARTLNLKEGDRADVNCAAGGQPASVWGTGVYTADSSICTAAVYDGLVTATAGGTVTIEVTKGQASYQGGQANGVTTSDYGAYDLSFRFVEKSAG